jgi:pimeloyl-ACP methyl ester carboxylesterase
VSTFVLVHGGRLGGWCWRDVRPRLVAAGHAVHTPTLTGVGERAHLARPDVDLETHVRDVVATLEFEGLTDVTLVGHSYAGMVITAAAEHVADRIRQLVYLDAIVPRADDSVLSVNSPGVRERMLELAREHGDGWLVPAPDGAKVLGTDDPAFAWAAERLTGQPLATYLQPIPSVARAATLPRTYLRCAEEGNLFPSRFADEARSDPAWVCRDLPCGHNGMILTPSIVAAGLLELIGEPASV